jgi:hypothetical protein
MKNATRPSVGKLLRVLVAGGVALASAGPLAAEAEEAPAKTDKAAEQAATPKPADPAAAKKKPASAEKEKPKEAEKKPEEAGGVKGW